MNQQTETGGMGEIGRKTSIDEPSQMRTIVRTLMFITTGLFSAATFAQQSQESWLVETMYKSGKINGVVAVVAVLIAGLAAWMFVMDRKVRRMEREQQQRD